MKMFLTNFKKHIIIFFMFMKNCLIAQMEYRFNFFVSFLLDCAFFSTRILYVAVVYQTNSVIFGLTPDAILLFVGTFTLISGAYAFFFVSNFFRIPEYVGNGSLDMLIVKPVSLQFIVTLRYFDFGLAIPDLVGGLIMVCVAWSRLGIVVNFPNIAGYVCLLVSGTVTTYAIFLLPHLLAFWAVRTNAIGRVADNLFEFNNMPMLIYNRWIQRMGVFVIPLFVISNFAPMFLLGRLTIVYAVWAVLAPVLLIVLIRVIWNSAIKNYTSASS